MLFRKTENGYVIRIEKDERVAETLVRFCKENGVQAGFFHGLGAVKDVSYGYYDLDAREYRFQANPQLLELASMNGNVAYADGETVLHIHAVFAERHEAVYAGHVQEMTAGVTVEVFLAPFNEPIERAYDEETGLKLLNL